MKKILLLFFLLPLFATAQQTYFPAGVPSGSVSTGVTFRYKAGSTDSLNNIYLTYGGKTYQFYTAPQSWFYADPLVFHGGKSLGDPFTIDTVKKLIVFTHPQSLFSPVSSNDLVTLSYFNSHSGLPAGSNTQIQYNNSGTFGASANFVWDNVHGTLNIGHPNLTGLVTSAVNVVGRLNLLSDSTSGRTNWYFAPQNSGLQSLRISSGADEIMTIGYNGGVRIGSSGSDPSFNGLEVNGGDSLATTKVLRITSHHLVNINDPTFDIFGDGSVYQYHIAAGTPGADSVMVHKSSGEYATIPISYFATSAGGVPTSRTITINGSTQDLSANRTWTIAPANTDTTSTGFAPKAALIPYLTKAQIVSTYVPGTITAANKTTAVVSTGDSMSTLTWETQLQSSLGSNYSVLSFGRPGDQTNGILARQNGGISSIGASYEIVLGGINDISAGVTALQIEANLQAVYTSAHNAGSKVIALTILPFGSASIWTSGRQAVADSVNTWILGTATNLDYKIDMRPVMWDPSNHQNLNPTYASADNLHPNTTGYNLMGTTIYSDVPFAVSSASPILYLSQTSTIDQNLRSDQSVYWNQLNTNILKVTSSRDPSYPMPQVPAYLSQYFVGTPGAMFFDTTNMVIRVRDDHHYRMTVMMDSLGSVYGNLSNAITLPAITNVAGILSVTNTATNQFNIQYDVSHVANFNVNSGGTLTINTTAGTIASSGVFLGSGFLSSSTGLINSSTGNNAAYATASTGPVISRNVADANPSLIVSQTNASSTGDIVQWKNSTGIAGRISQAGQFDIGVSSPTAGLTIGSTQSANAIDSYNTSDQTTNYERARQYWNSNVWTITTQNGGTGTLRNMNLNANSFTLQAQGVTKITVLNGANLAGGVNFGTNVSGSGAASISGWTGNFTNNSGTAYGAAILPTVNQSSTAASTALWISPFYQASGSGSQLLIDAGTNTAATGAGTYTSKFKVDNSGNVTIAGSLTAAAGGDVAITQATADLTAQSSTGNITTFTVGASTATFNVSAYLNVTAISTDQVQVQIAYTDENSTSQTVSLTALSAIGNSTYSPITIRAKNATVITVKTNNTVGGGTETFDAGARITQL